VKILFYIVLVIVVCLAITSGVTKIMLQPQDVELFAEYGFSNPILIMYGCIQLIGGILLAAPKTRTVGAALIAVTFLISAAVLALSGNIAVTLVTLVFTILIGFIVKFDRGNKGRVNDT
jgi:hypothetical protein